MVNVVKENLNKMGETNEICVQKGECAHECIQIIEKQLGKLINTEITGSTEELEEKLLDISDETFYKVWDYFVDTKMNFNKVISIDNRFKVVDVYDKNDNIVSISLNYKTNDNKLIFTEVLAEAVS